MDNGRHDDGMTWHICATGDWHCGSIFGLVTPDTITLPNGGTIAPSASGLWLHEAFTRHLGACAEHAATHNADRRVMLLNGDLVDGGMHHGTVELYHPDDAVEKDIAHRVIAHAFDVYKPTEVFLISGTPSHVGRSAGREESLASFIASEWPGLLQVPPSGLRKTWGVLRLLLGGVLFDVRHHGKLGRLPHTRESYHKRAAFDMWSSQAMYKNADAADVAIRSHLHKYSDSGPVAPHKNGTRAFALPCYQLGGEFIRKLGLEEMADIGMLGLVAKGGRLRDPLPLIDYPSLPEDTWAP